LQATQTITQAKAYKRVCLSNRTDNKSQQIDKPPKTEGKFVKATDQKVGFCLPKNSPNYRILKDICISKHKHNQKKHTKTNDC